jgi:hypothetical protein
MAVPFDWQPHPSIITPEGREHGRTIPLAAAESQSGSMPANLRQTEKRKRGALYRLSSVMLTLGTSVPGARIRTDCRFPRVVSDKLAANATLWATT